MSVRTSPFLPFYEKAGASFEEVGGARVPSVVTRFEEEYEAALRGAVLIDRSHRARLRVTGRDRESLLHNLLSADVKSLAPGKARPSVFLTNKGKVIADFVVLREDDAFVLDVEAIRADPLTEALSRYVIAEDVTIETAKDASFSVEGERAAWLLRSVSDFAGLRLDELSDLETATASFEGANVLVIASRREPSPRYDLVSPEPAAVALFEAVASLAPKPGLAGERVAEARRIEAGRARYGFDVDESHLPQEAALDDAISFDKGCYIGQEYVVRLAHRGQVAKRLSGLLIDGAERPARGTALLAGDKRVGEITSAERSPRLGSVVALGYVRRGHFEPGTRLVVGEGREAPSARVAALPFEPPV